MFDSEVMVALMTDEPVRVRILPGEPMFRKEIRNYDGCKKAVERFFWRVVVRGQEAKGVQILHCGKSVHYAIIRGLLEIRVPPVLSFFQKIASWLTRMPILDTIFAFLDRWVPRSTGCVELDRGYDFRIQKKIKHGFPVFDTEFDQRTICPAGTPDQINEWTSVDIFETSLKGIDHGNQVDEKCSEGDHGN